jgi:AraC-like DNA-binding protein
LDTPIAGESAALQRLSAIAGAVPALLAEFGCGPDRALQGLPLDVDVFDDPERLIPYSWVCRMLENCATATGCEHFGLVLGSRFDHRSLGVPGARMQQAGTLGEALSIFVALHQLNSRGAAAYLHRWGETFVFGYGIYDRHVTAREQIHGLNMALGLNIVRQLTNGAARIFEVTFSSKAPSDLGAYRAFFGVPLRFGQAQTGLLLPRAAMELRPTGRLSDREVQRQERESSVVPGSNSEWTDLVRHRLRPLLLTEDVTSASVASTIGLSAKALSRRLASEGTTFQRILDEVRFVTACELLDLTELPIGDIAQALCYASAGAFTDAFKRWSGSTPAVRRKNPRP